MEQISVHSPGWVKPDDLMRNRNAKAKRRALIARMSTSSPLQVSMPSKLIINSNNLKRKNPFRSLPKKISKLENDTDSSEASSEDTIFRLLNPSFQVQSLTENKVYNFSNILNKSLPLESDLKGDVQLVQWSQFLKIDWSLKTRVRFYSKQPLPWKHTFKTSEEASGTTGFVRCLDTGVEDQGVRNLDTSSNAQFYQRCLVWQHPNLPLPSLYPRDKEKIAAQTGIYGTDKKLSQALHEEWGESLRSLFQLLRVRQCPYFYVCGHSFTCLFRAVGVGGWSCAHAFITPTTRGFRDAMNKEGIEFTMPFYSSKNFVDDDGIIEDEIEENDKVESDGETDEPASSWLEGLGLETSQFPSLVQNRVKLENKKFQGIDGSPKSLIQIEDMELQGLINFLLNCSTSTSTTGIMAGVPPTILAPVAFNGATLKNLKVSGGQIRTSTGETNYSLEIRGPILPTATLHLCSLLSKSLKSYSMSLVPVLSTNPFCNIRGTGKGNVMTRAFSQEGLIDCGLSDSICATLCTPLPRMMCADDDSSQTFDSSRNLNWVDLPNSYREIIYEDGKYSWNI